MTSKGVTPVVATVLLIGISVGATVTAYEFILGAQDTAQDSYEDRREQERLEDATAIDLEFVYKSTESGDWAMLSVRNTGTRTMEIKNDDGEKYWSVFVDGKPVGNAEGTGWEFATDEQDELDGQEVISLNTTTEFPESDPVDYKITARYGAEDTKRCGPEEGSPC